MPDLARQTPRQREQMTYMMDVMRRLEWALKHQIGSYQLASGWIIRRMIPSVYQ